MHAGEIGEARVFIDDDIVRAVITAAIEEGDVQQPGGVEFEIRGRRGAKGIQSRKVDDHDLRIIDLGDEIAIVAEGVRIAPDVAEIERRLAQNLAQIYRVSRVGDAYEGDTAGIGGKRIFLAIGRSPAADVVHHALGPDTGHRQGAEIVGRNLAEELHVRGIREWPQIDRQAGDAVVLRQRGCEWQCCREGERNQDSH